MDSSGARAVRKHLRWREGGTDMWPLLRDPIVTEQVAVGLAQLHQDAFDVVLGPDPGGILFGPLAARQLGVPFAPVCRDRDFFFQGAHAAVEVATSRGRLLVHRAALYPGARVLLVDDWSESGSTVTGVRALVEQVEAELSAVAFVVDSLAPQPRAELGDVAIAGLAVPAELTRP